MKTFEDYLYNKHAEQYAGPDDMIPDDYNDWIERLDKQEIIDLAEKWGKQLLTPST